MPDSLQQAGIVQDADGPDGIMRNRIIGGTPMIYKPFLPGNFKLDLASAHSQARYFAEGYPGIPNIPSGGWFVDIVKTNVNAGEINSVQFSWNFWGTRLEIVALRNFSTDRPNFGLQIDREAVDFSHDFNNLQTGVVRTILGDGEGLFPFRDGLKDGPHEAVLTFTPFQSGVGSGSDSNWFVYGYKVESKYGIEPYTMDSLRCESSNISVSSVTPTAFPNVPVNLPSSLVPGSNPTGIEQTRFRRVQFINTNGSAVKANIRHGVTFIAWNEVIAANSQAFFDPGDWIPYSGPDASATYDNYRWSAWSDTANVNMALTTRR